MIIFDKETKTFNKGHPFDPRNRLISYSYMADESNPSFSYYNDPDFTSRLRDSVDDDPVVCGFNIKFDLHWARIAGTIRNFEDLKVWDCQLAEFIYCGQENPYASLNDVCAKYGLPTKVDAVAEYWSKGIDTADIPINILEEYNNWDVQLTKMLFDVQQELLSDKQKRLVWLLGEDLKTLQEAEFNGIKFDVEGAKKAAETHRASVLAIEEELSKFLPEGIPPGTFNWNSGDHLSGFLYGGTLSFDYATESEAVYKSGAKKGEAYTKRSWHRVHVTFPQHYVPLAGTEVEKTKKNPTATTRFYSTDAPTLAQLKARTNAAKQIKELLSKRAGANKVSEMIESILKKFEEKHWENNLVHGQFNQNVVVTGRLSSSAPNLQNQPPEIDEFFVSRYV